MECGSSEMSITERRRIPSVLEALVPECSGILHEFLGMSPTELEADDSAWYDLYDFLFEIVYRRLIRPELERDAEVRRIEFLNKCFMFVENLLLSSVASISDAAYFECIEPLFEDEALLVSAFPVLKDEARRVLIHDLDPEKISTEALRALKG